MYGNSVVCPDQDVMGDKWQIFLLEDKEEKPTAVLLPSDAREGVLSPVTEIWLFVLFGLATIISSLQSAGVPVYQFLTNPFYTEVSQQVRSGLDDPAVTRPGRDEQPAACIMQSCMSCLSGSCLQLFWQAVWMSHHDTCLECWPTGQ